MAYRTATNPETGEKRVFRSATNKETGETRWFPVDSTPFNEVAAPADEEPGGNIYEPPQPKQAPQPQPQAEEFKPKIRKQIEVPETMPFGMTKEHVGIVNKQIKKQNEFQRSLQGNKQRQEAAKQEEQRSFWSGVGEGLKHMGKEFYTGTLQSPDILPEPIQKILDYRIGGGDNTQTRQEQKKEIDEYMKKEGGRYDITRQVNPLSTTIGEIIPFLATGAVGESALLKLGSKVKPLVKGARIGSRLAAGDVAGASRIANMADKIPSTTAQAFGATARGTATGAAEGAAQHDTSALEGAATALVGGVMGGSGLLKPLEKVRTERDVAGKKLIDQMSSDGIVVTPGVRTNNKTLQKQEAALRNSDLFAQDFYNTVDRRNERRMTDIAGEAIGLPAKNKDMFSQDELANHMANLQNEYKQLEVNTVGKFSQDSFNTINKMMKDAQPTKHRNASKAAQERYGVIRDTVAEMRTVLQPFMTKEGRFQVQRFDGSNYQAASQYLNDQISKAYRDGDKILGKNLKVVKRELDKSIESGMGKAKSKEWRDLNERYALTRMLIDDGMTPSGKVSPAGITKSVMSGNEALRTLTSKGNRIRRFQDIARYNDVLKDVEGGPMVGGLGMADHTAAPQRGMMTRAADLMPSPIQHLRLAYKTDTSGLPFSPIHGLTRSQTTQAGRAFAQTETPQDYVKIGYKRAKNATDALLELLQGNLNGNSN